MRSEVTPRMAIKAKLRTASPKVRHCKSLHRSLKDWAMDGGGEQSLEYWSQTRVDRIVRRFFSLFFMSTLISSWLV